VTSLATASRSVEELAGPLHYSQGHREFPNLESGIPKIPGGNSREFLIFSAGISGNFKDLYTVIFSMLNFELFLSFCVPYCNLKNFRFANFGA